MCELLQFIPKEFQYLTANKKIVYKGINIKTDYLINIINDFILRKMFDYNDNLSDSNSVDLYSIILKQKYGKHYNYYMDYLVEYEYLILKSNYYSGYKCKTYRVNDILLDELKRCKITDNILIKKIKTFTDEFIDKNTSIMPFVRDRLIRDLNDVCVDYFKAFDCLTNMEMDKYKKIKNFLSIESIKSKHLFYKFDEYGRFHTNFTILKKEIRSNYIYFNDEFVHEIDIKNSQPLFLSILIYKMKGLHGEYKDFYDVVVNGLIYEQFQNITGLSRKEVKKILYKVMFGFNSPYKEEDKIFKLLYPCVYKFIVEYKKDDYKILSHKLQNMESNFIFNHVVKELYEKIEDIKIYTVHDSINFQYRHKLQVELIYNKIFKKLINNNLEI